MSLNIACKILGTRAVTQLILGVKLFVRTALICGISTHCVADVLVENQVTIGMSINFKPYNFSQQGEYRGVDVDLASTIFSRLNYKIHFVELPLPRLTAMANNGAIDIALTVYCDDPLSDGLLITQEPFYLINASAFELVSNPTHIDSSTKLTKGYAIGAVRGSRLFAELSQTKTPYFMLALNAEQLVQQLINKRIDLAFGEDIPIQYFSEQAQVAVNKVFSVSSYQVCMGISKIALGLKAKELVNQIDEVTVQLKKEGVIKAILNKYINLH